jgi:hypothetical protein
MYLQPVALRISAQSTPSSSTRRISVYTIAMLKLTDSQLYLAAK